MRGVWERLVLGLCLAASAAWPALAQPGNDDCSGASYILEGVGSYYYSDAGATPSMDSTCSPAGEADIWYYCNAYTSSPWDITLTDSAHRSIAVYDGCAGAEVACSSGPALNGVPVTAGQYYYIRVSGAAGLQGNFAIEVTDNLLNSDTCERAVSVYEGFTSSLSDVGASPASDSSCGPAGEADMWAYFYWPQDAPMDITLSDSAHRNLALFDTCGGTELACANGPELLDYPGLGGQYYYLRIAGDAGLQGSFTLLVDDGRPQYDYCGIYNIGIGADYPFDDTGATPSVDASCSAAGLPDIWTYVYAQTSAPLDITLTDSVHRKLAVFEACGGTEIACADGPALLDVSVSAGQYYHIRVAGEAASQGAFSLRVEDGRPPTDDCGSFGVNLNAPATLDDTGATSSVNTTCGPANQPDIWVYFYAQYSLPLDISLTNSAHRNIAVFDSCGGTELDCASGPELLDFPAVADQWYQIRIGGDAAQQGVFELLVADGRPANDDCLNAIVMVDESPVTGTTVDSINELGDHCGQAVASDVWYRYENVQQDPVTFYLESATTHSIAIYDSCNGGEVSCSLGSTLNCVSLNYFQTYWVRVSATAGQQGPFTLTAEPCSPPVNDACVNATVIREEETLAGTTRRATGTDETPACGAGDNRDVWYQFVPVTSQSVDFRLETTGTATLALYDNCGSTPLACMSTPQQELDCVAVTAAQPYWIRVAGFGLTAVEFSVSVVPCLTLANDACQNGIPLTPGVPVTASNVGATGTLVSSCSDDDINNDVWFSFNPATTGYYLISLCGSDFDTVLSIYDRCGGGELSCSDDNDVACETQSQFDKILLTGGETYPIRVAGFRGARGNIRCEVTSLAPPNDTCATAEPISLNTSLDGSLYGASPDLEPYDADAWFVYHALTSTPVYFRSNEYSVSVYDACGGSRQITNCIPAEAGDYYYIRVFGDVSGALGDYTLHAETGTCARPANDACADAQLLDDGVSVSANLTYANPTPSLAAPSCAYGSSILRDVWFRYVAPRDQQVGLEISGYTDEIAIYDSCGGTELACTYNYGRPCLAVVTGEDYYFRVTSDSTYPDSDFSIRLAPQPTTVANDTCATAQAIGVGTTVGNLANADDDVTLSCENNPAPDVWYSFTPASDTWATVTMSSSSVNLDVAIFDSCGGSEQECNQGSLPCRLYESGQTYYLAVSSQSPSPCPAEFSLNLTDCAAPVPNDVCAMAEDIGLGSIYGTLGTLTGADETPCVTNDRFDAWYRYTPTADGEVTIGLSTYDSGCSLAIFDQCGGAPSYCFEAAYSNSPNLQCMPVTANTPYLIRVARSNSYNVGFTLSLSACSVPANDTCEGALAISPDINYGQAQWPSMATGVDVSACGVGDAADLWYKFTPNSDREVEITAGGYEGKTFALFDACGGIELACSSEGPISCTPVSHGQTYLLRLGFLPGYPQRGVNGGFFVGIPKVASCTPTVADECVDAIPITEGETRFGTVDGATDSGVATCQTGIADVWYVYTPTADANVTINASGANAVSLYDSCGGNEIDCSSYPPRLDCVPVTGGTPYFIRVADYDSSGYPDRFDLTITACTPPASDDCANAAPITSPLPFSVSGEFALATGTDVSSCVTGDSADVWYYFTPATDVWVDLSLYSSGSSSTASLWDACNGSELACSVYGTEEEYIGLQGGSTYYLRVADQAGSGESYQAYLSLSPTPLNIACEDAEIIPDNWSDTELVVSGATALVPDSAPSACGVTDTQAVWYSFTPNSDREYDVLLCANSPSTTLSIFDDCGGTALACVVGDSCSVAAPELAAFVFGAGVTYYFRVADAPGEEGAFQLKLRAPETPYDECVIAQDLELGVPFHANNRGANGLKLYATDPSSLQLDFADVWFKYTPENDEVVDLSTCGSAVDTTLSVYADCVDTDGEGENTAFWEKDPLFFNRDHCGRQSALCKVPLIGGQAYMIRVASENVYLNSVIQGYTPIESLDDPTGDITVEVAPAGDLCNTAGVSTYRLERYSPALPDPWYFEPVSVDTAPDGSVYVADGRTNQVHHLSASGHILDTWGGAWKAIYKIAVGPLGEVYVVAKDNSGYGGVVYRHDSAGRLRREWAPDPGVTGNIKDIDVGIDLTAPAAATVTPSVVVSANGRIYRYTRAGVRMDDWGEWRTGGQTKFFQADQIALTPDGDVLIEDTGGQKLKQFSIDGVFRRTLVFSGYQAYDLDTDAQGNIYTLYASTANRRRPDGTVEQQWTPSTNSVWDLSVAQNGEMYNVTDGGIEQRSAAGDVLTEWTSRGTQHGSFDFPTHIVAVPGSGGDFCVLDKENHRIDRFNAQMQYESTFTGATGEPLPPYEFSCLAVYSDGTSFAASVGTQILRFDANGRYVRAYDVGKEVTNVAASAYNGFIYVLSVNGYDTDVEIFDLNATPQGGWTFFGTTVDDLVIHPTTGDVFIARRFYLDFVEQIEILHYSATGEYRNHWGMNIGNGIAEFSQNGKRALALHPNGESIYVADPGNSRIQWFTLAGEYIGQYGEAGVDPGQFDDLTDISVANDALYTLETGTNRVQRLVPDLRTVGAKAIVVAGGGSTQDNKLWNATISCANFANRALAVQGFNRQTIQYLAANTQLDRDQNRLKDDVDDAASRESLEHAIKTWSIEKVNGLPTKDLLIYLVDHGGSNGFMLNTKQTVDGTTLGGWLDELQAANDINVTVVLDACQAGQMLPELRSQTPGAACKRIVISSTAAEERAYFVTDGQVSFSRYLFSGIMNGQTLGEAFRATRDALSDTYAYQTPLLDDNCNGVGKDDPLEFLVADGRRIGNGVSQFNAPTQFLGVTPRNQLVSDGSTATISVQVSDTDGLERVWAEIQPPGYYKNTANNAQADLPTMQFVHKQGFTWEGTYDRFTSADETGAAYRLLIYAEDKLRNTSRPEAASVVVGNPRRQRAMIVTGGSSLHPLLRDYQVNATLALDALLAQGFVEEDIAFLAPVGTRGFDSLATLDAVAEALAPATLDNTLDLTVYLVGPSDGSGLVLSQLDSGTGETEVLLPEDLKALLDTAQPKISGKTTVICDFDFAGGFISKLAPPPPDRLKDRILVASCASDELALFRASGYITFSNFFWDQVLDGSSVYDAFIDASNAVGFSGRHHPQLDDTGDGVMVQLKDGLQALGFGVGPGILLGGDDPIIGDITTPNVITNTDQTLVAIDGVTTTEAIDRVYAIIIGPDGSERTLDLAPLPGGGYENVADGLNYFGTYVVAIFAVDNSGNVSSQQSTTITRADGPDVYEDDDTRATAYVSGVAHPSNPPQRHNFHDAEDGEFLTETNGDWVQFETYANQIVTIDTAHVGTAALPQIELWDAVSAAPIQVATPSLADRSASLYFPVGNAPGTYYVHLVNLAQTSGADTGYDLRIWEESGPCDTATPKMYVYLLSGTSSLSTPIKGGSQQVQLNGSTYPAAKFTDSYGYVSPPWGPLVNLQSYKVKASATNYSRAGAQVLSGSQVYNGWSWLSPTLSELKITSLPCGTTTVRFFMKKSTTSSALVSLTGGGKSALSDANGGTALGTVTRVGDGNFNWTISPVLGYSWLRVNGGGGRNDGSFTVDYDDNLSPDQRRGWLRLEALDDDGDPVPGSGTEVYVQQGPDRDPPEVHIYGGSPTVVYKDAVYNDEHAFAYDLISGFFYDGDITVINPVDTQTAGTYVVTYLAEDDAGNVGTAQRVVEVRRCSSLADCLSVANAGPTELQALEGDSVAMGVTATGDGTFTYQWYAETGGAKTAAEIPGANAPTLQLLDLTLEQTGVYYCTVTNGYEIVDSAPVTLTVNPLGSDVPVANWLMLGALVGVLATLLARAAGRDKCKE